ncbi:MAG: o-succinylbenzoate synthase [Bacteroidota bacterium]
MRLSLRRYRLPLTAPLVLKSTEHAEREGVLIRLDDGEGHVGWGDVAPLPGFSPETLDDALADVRRATGLLAEHGPGPDWLDPEGRFHRALDALGLSPSARFGLDLAAFDLAAKRAGRTLAQAMHPDPEVTVPINALLVGEPDAVLSDAERLVAAGYGTLKLKVGRGALDREIALVRALSERYPSVALRLDANQAWVMDEAVRFAEGIADCPLDYIEEPLADPADLPVLWHDTGLPVALDESLAGTDPGDLQGKGWATAAVLKPTLLGGVARVLRFGAAARALGIRPVLSGMFESGVAVRGHVALAAATGGAPAGLDPYSRLAADVLRPRLALGRPTLDVPSFFRAEHTVEIGE